MLFRLFSVLFCVSQIGLCIFEIRLGHTGFWIYLGVFVVLFVVNVIRAYRYARKHEDDPLD